MRLQKWRNYLHQFYLWKQSTPKTQVNKYCFEAHQLTLNRTVKIAPVRRMFSQFVRTSYNKFREIHSFSSQKIFLIT